MPKNMYSVAGDCSSNEALALRIKSGDEHAAALLLSQNEGYLTELALDYTRRFELEDLKQEGAMALLEAAKRFEPSYGTKLLTYAAPAIEAAISDYAAHNSLAVRIPSNRYNQLRKVAYICAEAENTSQVALTISICEELGVSPKVAAELMKEYQTLFHVQWLSVDTLSISYGGDPAKTYDRSMRKMLLGQLMEDVLKPRELNLVRSHLGIGRPDEEGMCFQELAVRLNYNGHSGAEKAYKRAICKLRNSLNSGAYGQWRSIQKAIRGAKLEAESDPGYIPPQTTWTDEKELSDRFLCEVEALIRVHEVFNDIESYENCQQFGSCQFPHK